MIVHETATYQVTVEFKLESYLTVSYALRKSRMEDLLRILKR